MKVKLLIQATSCALSAAEGKGICYIIPILAADTSLSGDVNFSPKTIRAPGRQGWKRARPFRWCKLSKMNSANRLLLL